MMTIAGFDGVYLYVEDLDRAINFYESVLQLKVKLRYEDRWAEFSDEEKGFKLSLFNPFFDQEIIETRDYKKYFDKNYKAFFLKELAQLKIKHHNAVIRLYTEDILAEYGRIEALEPMIITSLMRIKYSAPYRFFQFSDPDGNILEVYTIEDHE